ncbi:MAG: radical SAM family heme chaperone HemW [Oscillospiraceae bacterium]|jgi:oxygen-independent coproporphyrinogen-3 oxidase|nr:radical SAM family heme chaperone HemW [Oscillospiraceae bacterium]
MLGLYIHVPFCATKCPYCDFYSLPYSTAAVSAFIEDIKKEILTYPKLEFDTLYFGGGTPSLLPLSALEDIFSALDKHFSLNLTEATIEVNPNTVNLQKLSAFKSLGFNRLSVGVQSLNENELNTLGRKHTPQQALDCIENAKKAKFENISADIMLGIPNQTTETLSDTISKLNVQHISAYILKVEENTPFYGNITVDDDLSADLYLFAIEKLHAQGYMQYEISNFSKNGFESKHNLKYWHCEEYIGLGKSAHSFYNGKRYYNRNIITEENPGTFEERAMLGLRLTEGFEFENLSNAFKYQNNGFLEIKGNRVTLNPKGFLISNVIINDLV